MAGMGEFFDLSTVAKRVRLFGVLEAVSWVLLLTGSVLKRLPDPITWPVMVFGLLHGFIFLMFALNLLLATREYHWPAKTLALGLVSSVIPFTSVLFERWAIRSGQLGELSQSPAPAPAGS
ncbi:integral membrane protein [Nocardia pseudobrasiliensis]|uniref:Integral membrane protein n=2 Tax=Nocardia pseudobrasiliensis TaxID=45979 RepID=A0A370HWS5_9NOCA|nr:integral membrane protein [Nocardia pseudobrasiliensis]